MKISSQTANAAVNALTGLLDSGYIAFYSGVPPATADSPLASNTLLATLQFGFPAFGSASDGMAVAASISDDVSIDSTGTATWARLYQSDGLTVVCDMTVGTSGADINVSGTYFTAGAACSINYMSITLPKN